MRRPVHLNVLQESLAHQQQQIDNSLGATFFASTTSIAPPASPTPPPRPSTPAPPLDPPPSRPVNQDRTMPRTSCWQVLSQISRWTPLPVRPKRTVPKRTSYTHREARCSVLRPRRGQVNVINITYNQSTAHVIADLCSAAFLTSIAPIQTCYQADRRSIATLSSPTATVSATYDAEICPAKCRAVASAVRALPASLPGVNLPGQQAPCGTFPQKQSGRLCLSPVLQMERAISLQSIQSLQGSQSSPYKWHAIGAYPQSAQEVNSLDLSMISVTSIASSDLEPASGTLPRLESILGSSSDAKSNELTLSLSPSDSKSFHQTDGALAFTPIVETPPSSSSSARERRRTSTTQRRSRRQSRRVSISAHQRNMQYVHRWLAHAENALQTRDTTERPPSGATYRSQLARHSATSESGRFSVVSLQPIEENDQETSNEQVDLSLCSLWRRSRTALANALERRADSMYLPIQPIARFSTNFTAIDEADEDTTASEDVQHKTGDMASRRPQKLDLALTLAPEPPPEAELPTPHRARSPLPARSSSSRRWGICVPSLLSAGDELPAKTPLVDSFFHRMSVRSDAAMALASDPQVIECLPWLAFSYASSTSRSARESVASSTPSSMPSLPAGGYDAQDDRVHAATRRSSSDHRSCPSLIDSSDELDEDDWSSPRTSPGLASPPSTPPEIRTGLDAISHTLLTVPTMADSARERSAPSKPKKLVRRKPSNQAGPKENDLRAHRRLGLLGEASYLL
ncbi:hypothetical protein THASP1DRAFT_32277 [Thamnocephalis sphaerospora]|uniref:Uncharacterized protein n=1 Tax=Thamnocephalis sphaerospora TaxID=78915 RepID=A0A4P9XJG0_9FUNG|nr:hypothetical protein THASP1DRAFT_32277 [Thamnocephalis sphaerospora]|eukprot:RKP05892.1 hypothetical protein THASP1DRAFT_32277 [Thamnocephalis sphaerospora]